MKLINNRYKTAYLVGLIFIALVFWNTLLIYPIKLFVVMLHEMSHGLMAVLFGGEIIEIQIDKRIGGYCKYLISPSFWSTFMTSSAGYLGSLLWGSLILILAVRLKKDRYITLTIGILLLILSFFVIKSGELFGIGLVDSDRQLVRIDRSTGLGEVVGPIGFRNAGEIAYNPSNGGFYSTAADSIGGPTSLIQIDAGTGAGDLIGETDFLGFSGLAYDDRDNSLFGVAALVSDPSSTELVFVDSTTGTGVGGGRIDFTPEGFPTGLTYDPFSDQLLLSLQGFSDPFGFFSVPQTIYGINKQTSEIESFTFFTPNYSIGSLAFVPNAIPEPGAGCVLMFGLTGSLLRRRR